VINSTPDVEGRCVRVYGSRMSDSDSILGPIAGLGMPERHQH
jgi:hypothetical protein